MVTPFFETDRVQESAPRHRESRVPVYPGGLGSTSLRQSHRATPSVSPKSAIRSTDTRGDYRPDAEQSALFDGGTT